LKNLIVKHWGFRELRPLQEQGMRAVLDGRDSLVVLPTGGGKSLCYQAPALLRGNTTVVISPLISLMKDQVDSLQACGVPAVQINSSQTPAEQRACEQAVLQGAVHLLFISPERLVLTDFYQLLLKAKVRTFAIDEAHCISHWGHDFRPEYRQLNRLKELFPGASVHAYTATATERVRRDIIEQLCLSEPEVLIGDFDRPNLVYRVLPRQNVMQQVLEVLDRHPSEAGIIYCIRRSDVEVLTADLQKQGRKALPYHAGLPAEERKAVQDAFAEEQCDLVVATVAFGMGIHRSNIRFVLHAAMPKSLEHYQQEIGRAGRDGLEAECVLLYSGADTITWKWIIEKSGNEAQVDAAVVASAFTHLEHIDSYCRGALCRHRALVHHFGQALLKDSCGACDLCLGETDPVADSQVIAQKILSCVARVSESFGVNHVVSVLRGENTENVRKHGHDRVSTYGLMREHDKVELRDWIYQLIGQGVLVQQGDKYPILHLNSASWEIMRGQRTVRLAQATQRKASGKSAADASWDGVEFRLFEELRALRRHLAEQRHVPTYIILSDATLRELARARPSGLQRIRLVYGIGEAKLRDFGEEVLQVIDRYCDERGLSRDEPVSSVRAAESRASVMRPNRERDEAFDLFRKGTSVIEVAERTGRAERTVRRYLCDFIRQERPASVAAWVSGDLYERIADAAHQVGTQRLKPIFIALGEQVPYDVIQVVVTHLSAMRTGS
jgi:ATP-dependent DNA helicase RecQ